MISEDLPGQVRSLFALRTSRLMGRQRLLSPAMLLAVAALAAGGIYLLDLFVLEPDVARQEALGHRRQAAAARRTAGRALREEQRRLRTVCEALAARRAPAEAFVRAASSLADLDAGWVCGPDGQVVASWRRGREGPAEPPEAYRAAAAAVIGGRTDAGLARLGEEVVVFAGRRQAADGSAHAARWGFVACRVRGGLLARIGAAVGGEVVLAAGQRIPEDVLADAEGQWSAWPAGSGRLSVSWPAVAVDGRSVGAFRADVALSESPARAEAARRAILATVSLAAAAVLLVLFGSRVLLVNPIARLARRLRAIERGRFSVSQLAQGLHAEPLMLAKRLQAALKAMNVLSRTDALTGLANRRQFDQDLERAHSEAQRYGHPLSVMVMDIDLFKAVNDTGGHQAGDEVIQAIARSIKRCCRKADRPARLGGDEFAVLLPQTTAMAAAVVAERIRKTIAARPFSINASEAHLTVSIGIADMTAGRPERPGDLVALADDALYAAKQLGRNRFVQAHELEEQQMWAAGGRECDRVEILRGKLAGLDTQFKALFVRALQEIVQVMERRDPHMADHARKVQYYSVLIGRKMGLPDQSLKRVELAALLHDIGMLALPDSVALCPGRLDDEQMETMRRHPLIGAIILDGMEFLEPVIPVVRSHHEWVDGSGYPEGLKGEQVPQVSRIVALADAFDAMTSRRAFRDEMTTEEAIEEIRASSGVQFDPAVVEAFVAVAGELGDKLTNVPLPKSSRQQAAASRSDRDEPAPAAVG